MTSRPYQVCLYCGPTAPEMEGATVVDLTPASADVEAVIAALRSSGLEPSDLRARVLFVAEGELEPALATYSALLGFAGRRLDIAVGDEMVDASALDAASRLMEDAGRPPGTLDHIQVGAAAHAELPSVLTTATLTPYSVSAIRYARRARFVPSPGGSASALLASLVQLVVIAALRVRNENDRLPFLVAGDEPTALPEGVEVVGLCLETLRRAGVELRRSLRGEDRDSLVEAVEAGPRLVALRAAAALPIEETLGRLGSTEDTETELWHCPRPDRHSNGDANASLKVTKGRTRCYRCDPERMDSLRLVMDVKTMTCDEAADWLLAPAVGAAASPEPASPEPASPEPASPEPASSTPAD